MAQECEQISIMLPKQWLTKIDGMVKKHLYGATTRQDIIRAILAPALLEKEH